MRNPSGNGAYCDMCNVYMRPYNYNTLQNIITYKTEEGEYAYIHSRRCTRDKYHLCDKCYSRVLNFIHQQSETLQALSKHRDNISE